MRETIKSDLLSVINLAESDGTFSDENYETLQRLMDELSALTPTPRPADKQDFITDHWQTLYAQFGPRHTAGKSVAHDNMFHFVSWSNLPNLPFRNLDLRQEIHHETGDYNNVHLIEPIGGGLACYYTLFGRYEVEADAPQRYKVEFYRGQIRGQNGESDADIRKAFGFEADQALEFEMKKIPPLHSDIVYCDDDLRINYGSVGGKYILRRKESPWLSVTPSKEVN